MKPVKNKSFLFVLWLLSGCNNSISQDKYKEVNQPITPKGFEKFIGTWVNHDSVGFSLIEINDTADITYYSFLDRAKELKAPVKDRYYHYRSKGKMGIWANWKPDTAIWIKTDRYRLDFIVKKDTLIEFDKTGQQGVYIKVKNDEYTTDSIGLTEEEKRIGFDE
ncbi:MAG TPA: hypothetical protein VD794_11050 [Flavisolibacter sp.]|nr:hypothetical protein [Flavisolibacter sp.]